MNNGDIGAVLEGLSKGFTTGTQLKQAQEELNLKKKKQAIDTQLLLTQLQTVEPGTEATPGIPAIEAVPGSPGIAPQIVDEKKPKVFDPFAPVSPLSYTGGKIQSAPSSPSAPVQSSASLQSIGAPPLGAAPGKILIPGRVPVPPIPASAAVPPTPATPATMRKLTPEESIAAVNYIKKNNAIPDWAIIGPSTGKENDTNVTLQLSRETLATARKALPGYPLVEGQNILPMTLYKQLTGASASGAIIPDTQKMGVIKGLVDGTIDIKSLPYRGNVRLEYIAAAKQLDPSFDETQIPARRAIRIDFTAGKTSQNIRALNTGIGHLDTLMTFGQELDNNPIQAFNRLKQWYARQTGKAAPDKFDAARNAISGEIAAILKSSGATDQEISGIKNTINTAQSPEQLQGVDTAYTDIMASRLNAIKGQWEAVMPNTPFTFIYPKQQMILTKYGYDENLSKKTNNNQQQGKQGGRMMIDAHGNKAMVYPDGSFEEIK